MESFQTENDIPNKKEGDKPQKSFKIAFHNLFSDLKTKSDECKQQSLT